MDKRYFNFTIITIVIGLMLAIQFQTIQEPVVRDTRDTWELREDYMEQKEINSKLLEELRSIEGVLAKYETERKQSKEQALRETLDELKMQAGLTEITGPGVVLSISPAFEDLMLGQPAPTISPDLLKRLINEINMFNALYISIDGQRIINTTVIRDINGVTKIDGHSLNELPIEIRVVVDNIELAEKLSNGMLASQSAEELFRFDSLRVTVSQPSPSVKIPAYQNTIRVKNMETVESKEGGN